MPHMIDYIPYIALLIACTAASVTDIRSRKIPNVIPFSLVAVALIFKALHGPTDFITSIVAIIVMLLVGNVLFSLRFLGGGDIKLLTAGCAFLTVPEMTQFIIFTAIGGGLLAIGTAAANGTLKKTVSGAVTILHGMRIDPSISIAPSTQTSLPYAIAITFGAISVTLMHTFSPTGLRVF